MPERPPPAHDAPGDLGPRPAERLWRKLHRFHRALLLIAAVAGIVRLTYLLTTQLGEPGIGDALYYSRQADLNVSGSFFDDPAATGNPAADHPPLTALLLTPASLLPGAGLPYHRFTMTLLGVVAVVVIGVLGRQIAGERVGLVAAGIAAVYPNLWMNDALAMSETPATVLTACILVAIYRFIEEPSGRRAAWVGLWIGLGILARGELALLLPVAVLPVALWARTLPLKVRIGRAALASLVAVAMLVPWTAFNLARFEEPVLLSTNEGLTLLGANCHDVYHTTAIGLWSLQCAQGLPVEGDQSQVSRTYRDEAISYIRANRDRVPAVVAVRVARVWSFYAPDQMAWYNQGEGRPRWASELGLALYYPLLALAIAGVVVLRRRRVPVWPLVSTAVVVTITAAAFYGLLRFRIPAEVAIVVLAAVTLDAVARRWSARRELRGAPEPVSAAPVGSGSDGLG